MKKGITSKYYFREIFLSFLLVSIIPYLIFTSSIIFIYHSQSKNDINQQLRFKNTQYLDQINSSLDEFSNILSAIEKDKNVKKALQRNFNTFEDEMDNLIAPFVVGKDNKIAIHLISDDRIKLFSTNEIPIQYLRQEFADWGLMYKLNKSTEEVISGNYTSVGTDSIVLSLGKRLNDSNFNGYIIIDVYREQFNSFLGNNNLNEHLIVTDNHNSIIYNSIDKDFESISFSSFIKSDLFSESDVFYQATNDEGQMFNIASYIEVDNFGADTISLIRIFLTFIFLVTIISIYIANIQAKRIYRPVESIINTMRNIKNAPIVRMNEDTKHDDIKYIASEFNRMVDKIENLNHELIEQNERENIAEIKALQAQISPHFLYNMLNEIKSLAKLNRNEEVAMFIQHLGKMLRRSIDNADKYVSLSNDLDFIINYLELQKIRYEDAFTYDITVSDEAAVVLIPNLILQPIVENSIIHGFSSMRKDQKLSINALIKEDNLLIEINDNGRGIDKEKVGTINDKQKSKGMYGSHGLENIQRRLIITYGIDYGITVKSTVNEYTSISILIPTGGLTYEN